MGLTEVNIIRQCTSEKGGKTSNSDNWTVPTVLVKFVS